MLHFHQRMAELWTMQHKGKALTADQEMEMVYCLRLNADYAYKLADLHNMSLLASMTDDFEWQHTICRDIEKLEHTYGQKKKPTL